MSGRDRIQSYDADSYDRRSYRGGSTGPSPSEPTRRQSSSRRDEDGRLPRDQRYPPSSFDRYGPSNVPASTSRAPSYGAPPLAAGERRYSTDTSRVENRRHNSYYDESPPVQRGSGRNESRQGRGPDSQPARESRRRSRATSQPVRSNSPGWVPTLLKAGGIFAKVRGAFSKTTKHPEDWKTAGNLAVVASAIMTRAEKNNRVRKSKEGGGGRSSRDQQQRDGRTGEGHRNRRSERSSEPRGRRERDERDRVDRDGYAPRSGSRR